MNGITTPPAPLNEPVLDYAPGSLERKALEHELDALRAQCAELTLTVGAEQRLGGGSEFEVVEPHRRQHVLGRGRAATATDTAAAIEAAGGAAAGWRGLGFDERAAVFLRAADLLTGPWRAKLNAATMLGQSKTAYQAEIDSACELADFWRFNVHFARQIMAEQPDSARGGWNRSDYRSLEGFVYAITPFNFTAIAGNLPTAPALMGNTVLWKPSPTQQLAAQLTMRLLEAAGLPAGVINMLPGDGLAVSDTALTHPDLAGIHFTGSTRTFQYLWRTVGENIAGYRSYPRLVGETGGKDFVLAHPSADDDVLRTALIRGAYDYQGQKCSAASRAYVPASVWARLRDPLVADIASIRYGDVTDLGNFGGAVIDARAFARLRAAQQRAAATDSLEVLAGGGGDDSQGWFIQPTLLQGTDPTDEAFTTEYFGPILTVHVFADADYHRVLREIDQTTPYALTGSIIARDRAAIVEASESLRFAAGNFYINDKPTGAVVGQQPFGGARASGTNDKAGSAQNLLRWTSTRSIKETFTPPTSWRYPHQG